MKFFQRHRTLFLGALVYNLVLFAPVLFQGRVLSPNDLFFQYEPWRLLRSEAVRVENPLLVDPSTSYSTLVAMFRNEPGTFHWNPYLAAGVPGYGSSYSTIFTPLVFLPALLLPLEWFFAGMLFLKLNVCLLFAYLWLREEELEPDAAALGALVVAGSGIYAVRWMWQTTNATAFYPMLLWLVRRAFHGRSTPVALVALLFLAYGLAGFPAAIAYGLYLAIAYAVFLAIRFRNVPLQPMAHLLAGGTIATLVAAPLLVPFVQWIGRSGYLDLRRTASQVTFPAHHWRAFFQPDRLGNPKAGNWTGDAALFAANNYLEATIYAGIVALVLALVGVFTRRPRWFWIGAAVVIVACMFGVPGIAAAAGALPGFRFSMLTRVSALLPLAIGYLAACGMARRPRLAMVLAMLVALELAFFATRFHPYPKRADAVVPSTPTIDFLRNEAPPFRTVFFFDYFWPNAAEMFGVEDLRSHFASEGEYRRLLERFAPGASGKGTILGFHSLQFDFQHPLVGMLGVRYFVEPKAIDIVRWKTLEATVAGIGPSESFDDGALLQRNLRAEGEWAVEVPVSLEAETGPTPALHAVLRKDGAIVWSRVFEAGDIRAAGRIYVPIRKAAGELTLSLRSRGLRGVAGPHGKVSTPVVFERELPDGRIFRNLAEKPRFWPESPASVILAGYAPARQRVLTESKDPFLLASSEKLTPELGITVDGRDVPPVPIDTLFAGVQVPAGRHEVVFSRRIGRGWWPVAAVGAALWLASAVLRRWDHHGGTEARRSPEA